MYLVIIGANSEGKKELLGIADGYRESEESWKELLLELQQRGLSIDPKLATGDGGLGFWKALPQVLAARGYLSGLLRAYAYPFQLEDRREYRRD